MTREQRIDDNLVDLFRAQVRRQPDAAAVQSGGEEITYAELWNRAVKVAQALLSSGTRPGELVAVFIDRTIECVAHLLGVMTAGAAYVPIDPLYPAERIVGMITDARLTTFLGSAPQQIMDALPSATFLDETVFTPTPVRRDLPTPNPESPAYAIFTSGTTGLPKGCLVSHRNVVWMLRGAIAHFDVSPRDRWSLQHSFSFDFSVWEMWGAFATGGCVVLFSDEEVLSPSLALEAIARDRISVLSQVPSVFARLSRVPVSDASPPDGLRYVIFGGERIDLGAVRRFTRTFKECTAQFVNMYGITEVTVHASFAGLTPGSDDASIGQPLAHLRFEIHEGDDICEQGQVGELWISGPAVSIGYLARPELNATRFVVRDGERFYRTGDLVMHRPDGEYEYVGRADRQVKLRGYRIELEEIESVLLEMPEVTGVVVVVVSHPEGGDRLTAVLESTSTHSAVIREARSRAARLLPHYMRPSRYKVCENLPLTRNGKVDTKAVSGLLTIANPSVRRVPASTAADHPSATRADSRQAP
ncbi:amino acid adenylation domain-containing protein [Microbacterium enclense]|uniref:amino acid adenylation domain-containing protein n=1 Tax=Microbacterium enclense TaxID=993073 RepID=UPI003F7ECEED